MIKQKIEKLLAQKGKMVEYMLSKIEAEDWHAVADAAMDIREIEAEVRAYNEFVPYGTGTSGV